MRILRVLAALFLVGVLLQNPPVYCQEAPTNDTALETQLVQDVRQLTFGGLRAGEGYFSSDGTQIVFQSERDPANPFYQIFVMDRETGDVELISPGTGKTTCAWIHPDGQQVLFASTHEDTAAKDKQDEELALRAENKQRRYAWDYDQTFDLYVWDRVKKSYDQITDVEGYDAEASFSPDGKQIVFASNREAYSRPLSDREKTLFEMEPASMVDLYIMNSDGTNVRRLTDTLGYDGGPFFSADGKRICWRRFNEDGATAEIFTMNTDGSDVRRLTSLGAMSWAPYFHPSGDYLVFTTNIQGFANFELYLVRADGEGAPVRVTYTDGFDGLPVFTPDGHQLAWTTTRSAEKKSQIFIAEWNDQHARELLGLNQLAESETTAADRAAGLQAASTTQDGFSPVDVGRHVDYLTRPELAGRLTGTDGERRATAYVAAYLESLGFEPAGENGTFYHAFEFPAGASLTADNKLVVGDETLIVDKDWRPLSFSGSGSFEARGLVFAGYGLEVPESEGFMGYDSYVHLDVTDKWVLMFRDLPQDIKPELRQTLARFSSARRKAMVARDHGAYGVIFVAGPTSKVNNQLIRFESDASAGGTSIPVLSVSNDVAAKWMKIGKVDLESEQKSLDNGDMAMGYDLEGVNIAADIGIEYRTGMGRNVVARLRAGEELSDQVMIVGAHVDHLGMGQSSSSLAREDEGSQIHFGADDNASGVAAMLEIAQYLAAQKRNGKLAMRRDLIIAGWSGEELGLFGSQAYVNDYLRLYPHAKKTLGQTESQDPSNAQDPSDAQDPHAGLSLGPIGGHGSSADAPSLYPAIAGYLNLDMVGRLREKLTVQGIGSSPAWEATVQQRNVPVGLAIQLDKTSRSLPTDAAVFVGRQVPSLAAFTGAHEDYHTPRDTADKLNYEGAAKIARLFALIGRGLLTDAEPLPFVLNEGEAGEQEARRAQLTAYLGTIPDYAGAELKGVKLSGVGKNGPAESAGLKAGDVIVELAGGKIENIYDYTYAIEALKIGETVKIVVMRGEERLEIEVTPGSRE